LTAGAGGGVATAPRLVQATIALALFGLIVARAVNAFT
jgi:hypothetical protein